VIVVLFQKFVKEYEINVEDLNGSMSMNEIKDKTLYTEDSIESLAPLEFTRLRPQVYAGDCTYST